MSELLDREPRSLEQTLADTQAEWRDAMRRIEGYYRTINQLGERALQLEERAAQLGEEILRRSRQPRS